MRIALLHFAASPVIGGVESVMREHARLMARAGHKVRIIAGRGEQVDPEVEFQRLPLVDSIEPEVLELKSALDSGKVPPEFQRLSRTIEDQLRAHIADIDCLVVHNVCSLNKNLAATSALRRISAAGRPQTVLWHHDLAWTTPRYRPQLHEGEPWSLLRQDWPGVVQVTVSETRRRELAQLLEVPINRIRAVPNGIDVHRFVGLDEGTGGLARELGLTDADPLLLLPARVTPRKNIELALRVIGSLKQRWPRVKLLITGPVGPHNNENRSYAESLESLSVALDVQERVVFLSLHGRAAVSDEQVRQLYRLADALLLPSREEGFGIPILEAGLAGIPVFCSDLGSLMEIGRDDAIYFAPEADAGAVAEKITSTLSTDRRHSLRKRVIQEYSWDQIYERHIAPLLSELI